MHTLLAVSAAAVAVLAMVVAGAAGMAINITSNEQYTSVMRAEEYVYPNGTLGPTPPLSLFVGLLHVSVVAYGATTATIQTTIWHQVAFATQVAINGPASPGQLPPAGQQLVPLLLLAQGAAAGSANCPMQGTWVVTLQFLTWMRNNLLFASVSAAGDVNGGTGNLRGAVYSGRDALVTFMSGTPGAAGTTTTGMGIFRAVPFSAPTIKTPLVYLNYWILSLYTEGQFQTVSGGLSNLTSSAVFAPIPAGQSTAVTAVVSTPGSGPVVPQSYAYTEYPIVGIGSTNMLLILEVAQQRIYFAELLHVAWWKDYQVFLTNGSSTNSAGPALEPPFSASLVLALTLILALTLTLSPAPHPLPHPSLLPLSRSLRM